MSTSGKYLRGDIVLLPIAFVSGRGTKSRPAVVEYSSSITKAIAAFTAYDQ